jgi:hypothetical protein
MLHLTLQAPRKGELGNEGYFLRGRGELKRVWHMAATECRGRGLTATVWITSPGWSNRLHSLCKEPVRWLVVDCGCGGGCNGCICFFSYKNSKPQELHPFSHVTANTFLYDNTANSFITLRRELDSSGSNYSNRGVQNKDKTAPLLT